MCKGKQKAVSKVTAVLLTLMMVVVFIPTFAFAADGDVAEGITVFMTVSEQGQIAQTKDNEPMAWKEVKVTDRNNDSKYTFDEALVAAHEQYCSTDGYAAATSQYGTSVTKLWGKDTSNTLFFINDVGLSVGVGDDTVTEGDYLTASVNKDEKYYNDWYSAFDKREISTTVGTKVKLSLKGHLGMAYEADLLADAPLADVAVKDTAGNALGTTDSEGNVEITFNDPGTYVVTAEGVAKNAVGNNYVDYQINPAQNGVNYAIQIGSNMETKLPYTLEDYGNGPYPLDEIQYYDYDDAYEAVDEEADDIEAYFNANIGHLLYSIRILANQPLIAPACIVKVGATPADVTMTINNKGVLAAAKDGSAMIEKPVNVKDTNYDGKLSYDEALTAAHDAYFEGGAAAGYAAESNWVNKFWGIEKENFYEATNGTPIYGVQSDTVADGDALDVAIISDGLYYSDRVVSFDNKKITVEAMKAFSVQLTGKGMYDSADVAAEPFEGIKIGTWNNGAFTQLNQAITDKDGKVTVSFEKAGTYILTANGTVNRDVSVWDSSVGDFGDYVVKNLDCPIFAPYCIVKVTPHVHKLTAVKAKLATAKKAGNTAYWKCAGCGKFFSDAKGTKEIKKNSWVVKKSTMTVKAKTVKAKAKKNTIIKKTKAFTVKNNPGKVTFKKLSGNKKITVSKAGKVTVKKGLKKGKTYTVKVKVTSAKTKKYAAISKTVKLKVKITK